MNIAKLNFISEIKKIVLIIFSSKKQKSLFYLGLVVFFLLLIKFLFEFGPFYTTDIVDYSRMAKDVSNGFFPHSPSFSPGYPFFIGITSKLFSMLFITFI